MRRSRVVLAGVLILVTSLSGWWLGETRRDATRAARVTRAIDGDTVVVELADGTNETVRILGADTPETHDPRKPVQCFGPEAAAYTATRLTGRAIQLEGDVETRDIYGRLLAYVIVDGHRFEDELLRLGYARLLVIAPNRAHARALLTAELDARRHRRGLWSACTGDG